MALVLADRVKDTTTSTGTGTITLAGAPPAGFQSFAAIGDGNTTYYTISGGSQWEVGIGTYTASGTTLSRNTVLSSSAGGTSLVDFSAGSKDVFVTLPSQRSYGIPFSTQTANYAASFNEGILADTSGGAFTVTLPASPVAGTQVIVADAANTWGTNNLTVARNGQTIEGAATNLICDITGVSVQLIYSGTTWQVFAQAGGAGGSADINTQTTGTLLVSRGGTGATTLTGIVKGNGTSAFTAGTVALGSEVSGTLPVANGGTGATTLTANNVLLGNGTSALQVVVPGTTGNVLTSNGTTWISQAVSAANVQTFSSSGTWTKPSGAQFVLVEVWGAGGGGSRPTTSTTGGSGTISLGSGGGGGSYNFELFLASSLGATEVVTVGAGGTGGITNNSAGNNGGSTDFGQKVFGFGGAGGSNGSFGGGGGGIATASTSSTPGGPLIGTNQTQNMAGGYGGTSAARAGGASAYGGGGGGSGSSGTTSAIFDVGGGNSVYGAGGGGGPAAYRTISGSTNFVCQGGAGVGGSLASTTAGSLVRPFSGQNGVDYSGGAGGAYYEFPNFAMSQSNDSGIARFNANNGAQVVSVGSAGFIPFIFVSPDGVTAATPYPIPLGYQPQEYAVFHNGTSYVIFTINGIVSTSTFTSFTLLGFGPSDVGSINFVRYANGYFFITSNIDVFYSTDAISWTRANVAGGASVDIGYVAYDGTYYYAARSNGTVYRSTNLSAWTAYSSGAGGNSYYLAASPTAVVVGAAASPFLRISTNQGVTWANTTTAFANGIVSMNYIASQARWFAGTNAPALFTSTDGTNWVTANLTASQVRNVIHNGTVFAASARTSGTAQINYTATSATGAWTARTTNGLAATVTGQPGGNGGLGGGGGGPGGAATTTTGNGGNGGSGYCRVYTW